MSKGSGAKVYDYQLSIHYGICHGPIDSINWVKIKDKMAWCGLVTGRQDVCLDLPDIFGGDTKEGGVRGVVECYPGNYDQLASSELAQRYGMSVGESPAHRGIASMFFRGDNGAGFKWVTNNPYLPAAEVSVTRIPRQLNSQYAVIWPLGTDGPTNDMGWSLPFEVTDELLTANVTVQAPEFGFMNPRPDVGGGFVRLSKDNSQYCFTNADSGYNESAYENQLIEVDLSGNPVSSSANRPTDAEIDLGLARYTRSFRASGIPVYPNLAPATVSRHIVGYFYNGYTDIETGELKPLIWSTGSTTPRPSPAMFTSNARDSVTVTIPPGARFMRVYSYALLWGYTNPDEISAIDSKIDWQTVEYGHCLRKGSPTLPDANPANMLFELKTNDDWGNGETIEMIDLDSYQYASQKLYDERFGLSMQWVEQTDCEAMTQEILNHIKALEYRDPVTAKWTLKLLRDDYDFDNLEIITSDDCTIIDGRIPLWGEMINEMVVNYTDPDSEESVSVTETMQSTLAIQSGISSDSLNFYGVRNARLAKNIAKRELQEKAYPLWTGNLSLSRKFWTIRPGAVYRLQYPEDGIEDMVIRIMSVSPGRPGDRRILVSATEDVYSVDNTEYDEDQELMLDESNPLPSAVEVFGAIATPYPILVRAGATHEQIEDRSPGVVVSPLAADLENKHSDIVVRSMQTYIFGGDRTAFRNVSRIPPTPCILSTFTISAEVESTFPRALIDQLGRGLIFPGTILMLGSFDRQSEIIMLESFNRSTQEWDVRRGLWDTIPQSWPIGTPIWQMPDTSGEMDQTLYYPTVRVTYRLLPRTAYGRLDIARATPYEFEIISRPHRPFRPANCQIDGNGFGTTEYNEAPFPTEVTATWANRNRVSDEAAVALWNDPNQTPEDGQTTMLRITDVYGNTLVEYSGLVGTSHVIPASAFDAGGGMGYVEFYAARDGMLSMVAARRLVRINAKGWAEAWSEAWG